MMGVVFNHTAEAEIDAFYIFGSVGCVECTGASMCEGRYVYAGVCMRADVYICLSV